jgi:hypothetical protein
MKNLILLLSIILCLSSFGQVGVGKYKLGSTLNSFPELENATKVRTTGEYHRYVYKNTGPIRTSTPVEMLADTNAVKLKGYDGKEGLTIMEASFSYRATTAYGAAIIPSSRNFYLGRMKINESLELHEVKLFFYKDTLYKIQVDEDISELLEAKYGTSIDEVKEKKVLFSNSFGTTIEKTETDLTRVWKENKSKIVYRKYNVYSDNGENSEYKIATLCLDDYEYLETTVTIYRNIVYQMLIQKEKNAQLKDF